MAERDPSLGPSDRGRGERGNQNQGIRRLTATAAFSASSKKEKTRARCPRHQVAAQVQHPAAKNATDKTENGPS